MGSWVCVAGFLQRFVLSEDGPADVQSPEFPSTRYRYNHHQPQGGLADVQPDGAHGGVGTLSTRPVCGVAVGASVVPSGSMRKRNPGATRSRRERKCTRLTRRETAHVHTKKTRRTSIKTTRRVRRTVLVLDIVYINCLKLIHPLGL